MNQLIIAEKPQQAKKIAEALSDGKFSTKVNGKVQYYELTRNKKKIIVVCAVGHLYNLTEPKGHKWTYPFFDYEWKPVFEINKAAAYTKQYVNTILKASKDIDEVYVSTDFDEEGSLLGERIVTLLLKRKDAKRMKFSSLTKDELIDAYEKPQPHIDWPNVLAGMTRHELDFLWGLNCSRALTLALKSKLGGFNVLSTGRVQGPTLSLLTELDKQIEAFKPKDYWEVYLTGKLDNTDIKALHETDKFWEQKQADEVLKNTKGQKASVLEVKKREENSLAPYPFDLTTLQTEAYRHFRISPKEILSITQSLYTEGLITYPRTSSQQIPPNINVKEIINKLSSQPNYSQLCKELLSKGSLKPSNGKKTDPAHPACIVTGEKPKKLAEHEAKVYDLIARRTMATFGEPAKRESQSITIKCDGENFSLTGSRTTYEGWHKYYKPYVDLDESTLPEVKKGEEVKNPKTSSEKKQTKPPKRYTPASLVKKMEGLGLGTKTTRALIIDILFERNYLDGKEIATTKLGRAVTEALAKHVPELISPELTKEFEEDMDEIIEGKNTREKILESSNKVLKDLLDKFKKDEKAIGEELAESFKETREEQTAIGKCNVCKDGELRIMYSRKNHSYFIACNKYPACKNTFSIPIGLPKPTGLTCPDCKFPTVKIIRKAKRPFDFCINKNCPKKKEWYDEHMKDAHKEK